ncbi:LytTR family transcriptional regulator [Lacihabitans sp. LS3-19]|uniref:LytTR family DNA-binding domain-containing protein n=1 Tax=Lacihabitans sp. LS3-19 TaxID=2487335 RepID=UPI0020CD3C32|nr:LytTR family DNA-binding domain-containing protein [Lacihabitans sp. LS3-19]MCP9768346.1 LytTR family transcriptional regulator [Lacihabitans sp. LS3-19]
MKDNFINIQKQYVDNDEIAVKEKGQTEFICLKSIVKLESDKNYTLIYLSNGRLIISSRTLQLFEQLLSVKTEFLRVNRSEIINLNHVIYDQDSLKLSGKTIKQKNIKISRRRGSMVASRIMNFSNILAS